MDKKSISFLALGLLLGVFLTASTFSWLGNRSADSGGTGTGAGAGRAKVVLKLAHVLPETHPVHAAMAFMAERLKEKSSGSVDLQVFPSGQLGGEADTLEQARSGVLAMVKTSAAVMESFVPEMSLFGLPYLFDDAEHYWKVLNGPVGNHLLEAGSSKGLRGLCYYDSGSRSFYTKGTPVLSPADLGGKKIRVMKSPTAMDMVKQMGGAPTPLPFSDLYMSLSQGMVDGAENNPPSIVSNRHHEVVEHYSLNEHTRIPDMVVFSNKIWDKLDPQVQAWIKAAAAESVEYQRKAWTEENGAALKVIEKAGVKIHRPDKAPFQEKVQSMYAPLTGTALGKLVERVRAQRTAK